MKKVHFSGRILAILAALALLLQTIPLGASADGVHSPGEGITVSRTLSGIGFCDSAITLCVGESKYVCYYITPEDPIVAASPIIWRSSAPDVASVSAYGVITANSIGTAQISAELTNGSEYIPTVDVTVAASRSIPVQDISIYPMSYALTIGDTTKVTSVVRPLNATNKKLTWSSGNTNIASVDQNGNVTAKAVGSVTIYAKATDGSNVRGELGFTIQNKSASSVLIKGPSTLDIGATAKYSALVFPLDAPSRAITWTSSDPSVLSIDSSGNAKMLKTGYSTIYATAQDGTGMNGCLHVYSTDYGIAYNPITSIAIHASKATINTGESIKLSATITPSNATEQYLVWSTSNPNIAYLQGGTTLMTYMPGKVTVTAISTDGSGVHKSIDITVLPTPVKSITFNTSRTALGIFESMNIAATVSPEGAANKNLAWVSSNPEVAYVGSDGTVIARQIGRTTITAMAVDGSGVQKSIDILVKTPEEMARLVNEIELSPQLKQIDIGESFSISARALPETALEKAITWSSSNASIATVDASGKVTGKKGGMATITAAVSDGSGVNESCVVTVFQPVESLWIESEALELEVDDEAKWAASVAPTNATIKSVSWSSNNAQVASVDTTGKITGKKAGKATITATAKDGSGVKASKTVTVKQTAAVKPPVTSVRTNLSKITIAVGQTVNTVTAEALPENAANRALTYASGNTGIAKVDKTGAITGVKKGTATVKITAADGSGKTATVTVKVVDKKKGVTSMSLSKKSASVLTGKKVTLKAKLKPSNAKDKKVTWVSSDKKIATVSSKGVVKGIAPGKVTITATASSGHTAKCTVTVKPTPVSKLKFKKTKVTLKVNKTHTQLPTITPSSAGEKTLTWSSNDKKIATVDKNGLVTAHKAGKAKITAKSHNGKKATYTITVKK